MLNNVSEQPPTAVIMAGGKGTRMKSELPKVLCPVAGRPMIHFVIDALAAAGIGRHLVVVGYRADDVRQELQNRPEPIEFVLQQQQLGTGHAVQVCRPALADQRGPTVVVTGDSPLLQSASLSTLLRYFHDRQPALLLGSLQKADPTGLGRIVRDEAGKFLGIVEHKDATATQLAIREVNMSTYVFHTPDLLFALDRLSNDNVQGEYYLTDCAEILRRAGREVDALPVLQECEALSINNLEELRLVDETMRAMGYA